MLISSFFNSGQYALRAKSRLKDFAQQHNLRIAGWYVENASGAAFHRPEFMRLLQNTEPGDAIRIEQVDRLSRLDDNCWESLKKIINEKSLSITRLDLSTSYTVLFTPSAYDFGK